MLEYLVLIMIILFVAIIYKRKSLNSIGKISLVLLGIYSCIFCIVKFFPLELRISSLEPFFATNLVSFKQISQDLSDGRFMNILLNISFTLPFYPLLYFVYGKKSFKYGLLITLLIEPVQMLLNTMNSFSHHVIDIDDTILNLIGFLIGDLIIKSFEREVYQYSTK